MLVLEMGQQVHIAILRPEFNGNVDGPCRTSQHISAWLQLELGNHILCLPLQVSGNLDLRPMLWRRPSQESLQQGMVFDAFMTLFGHLNEPAEQLGAGYAPLSEVASKGSRGDSESAGLKKPIRSNLRNSAASQSSR